MTEELQKTLKISKKHEMFCRHYVKNGHNGAAAAVSAGYAKGSANRIAYQILKIPGIAEFINELEKPVLDNLGIDKDWVIANLKKFVEANITDYYDTDPKTKKIRLKDLKKLPKEKTAAIESIRETRDGIVLKLVNKRACVVEIGKYLGMFKEQIECNIINNLTEIDKDFPYFGKKENADNTTTELAGN
jgi:phage terminase small subunit